MGYSHQWRTKKEIDVEIFSSICDEVKRIFSILQKMGVKLANIDGSGEPTINSNIIAFNGLKNCGHTSKNVILAWPTTNAVGINDNIKTTSNVVNDSLSFTSIQSRMCPGDCTYEPFIFERISSKNARVLPSDPTSKELPIFTSCKTAFRPYDIAVMAVLVVIKHHLDDKIYITSDGDITKWDDAIMLIKHFLGYGEDFILEHHLS